MTRAEIEAAHVHRWLEVCDGQKPIEDPHEFWCPDCGAIVPEMPWLEGPQWRFDIHTDTPTPGWHP